MNIKILIKYKKNVSKDQKINLHALKTCTPPPAERPPPEDLRGTCPQGSEPSAGGGKQGIQLKYV